MLALDTASASGGVALVRGRAVLGEELAGGGPADLGSAPRGRAPLGTRGDHRADLDAVAVSAGPGSYTGLRVGFSLAKGMALARGLPVVAIPPWRPWPTSTGTRGPPLRRSRRREGAALRRPLRAQGGGCRRAGWGPGSGARWPCSPRTSWPGAWRQAAPLLVCGELYPRLIDSLRAEAAPSVRFVSPAGLRRPAFLAELALLRSPPARWATRRPCSPSTCAGPTRT